MRTDSPETLREIHHGVHSICQRGCTNAAVPPVNACAKQVHTSGGNNDSGMKLLLLVQVA
jgi:hypothetical protein